jgi:hypothetical protein
MIFLLLLVTGSTLGIRPDVLQCLDGCHYGQIYDVVCEVDAGCTGTSPAGTDAHIEFKNTSHRTLAVYTLWPRQLSLVETKLLRRGRTQAALLSFLLVLRMLGVPFCFFCTPWRWRRNRAMRQTLAGVPGRRRHDLAVNHGENAIGHADTHGDADNQTRRIE